MTRHAPVAIGLLRAFEAAARLRSFKAAADELCVTASAISQQVKSLEAQLGVTLFDRHARGLSLTAAGERYAADIRPHIAAIDAATRRLRATHPALLRVTLMPPLASRVVFPRLAEFRAAHPDVELRIDTSLREIDLRQGEVDLAIRSGTPPWPGCTHEKLADLWIQPVCPPAVAARFGLGSDPAALARAPLVHMTERPDSWPLYFSVVGLPAPTGESYHVDDYTAAIEAAETLGVALAALPLEKPLIDSGRVTPVGPVIGPLPNGIYAVTLAGKEPPAARLFLDWVSELLAGLAR